MEIEINELEKKGFAQAYINNKKAGVMSYSIAENNLIIIDHTEIEQGFKGKGVGKKLLCEIVDIAMKKM